MSLFDNLPHLCDIVKLARSTDDLGGDTRAATVIIESDIPCWVQNASFNAINEFAKQDERITHEIFFASKQANLTKGRMIRITSGEHAGETMKYIAASNATAGVLPGWSAMVDNDRTAPRSS